MDKLSLYDVLSFLLPGFLALEWIRWLLALAGCSRSLHPLTLSDFEIALLGSAVSFIAGLLIHRFTFFAMRLGWYKKLVFPSVAGIVSRSDSLRPISQSLDRYSVGLTGAAFTTGGETPPGFFDHCYYVLEATGKADSMKGFQSIYFFARNLLTLALCSLPLAIFTWGCHIRKPQAGSLGVWILPVLFLLLIPALSWLARFYRARMVERIFWSYHVLKSDPLK